MVWLGAGSRTNLVVEPGDAGAVPGIQIVVTEAALMAIKQAESDGFITDAAGNKFRVKQGAPIAEGLTFSAAAEKKAKGGKRAKKADDTENRAKSTNDTENRAKSTNDTEKA